MRLAGRGVLADQVVDRVAVGPRVHELVLVDPREGGPDDLRWEGVRDFVYFWGFFTRSTR